MSENLLVIPSERIVSKIYIIRNKKVMLDKDLAELYGVKTMVLNQAVKRNIKSSRRILCSNLIKMRHNL